MLPTTEKYQYITDGEQERAIALEKDQRIYAKPINLDGSVNEEAVAKLEEILVPLLEKQTALLKSGRILDAQKIEAEISDLLKERVSETVKKILPDNVDKEGRDARKIVSYVLATSLANYVNKDIYDGVSHETDKDGNIRQRRLEPQEKTFKDYLQYVLNRAAEGKLPEEEYTKRYKKIGDKELQRQFEEKFKTDELIKRNFKNPKKRKKVAKTVEKKGRPLTEKEIKVMKQKEAGSKR